MRSNHTRSTLSGLATAVVLSVVLVGCQGAARQAPEGMTADLERDLQLASTARSAPMQAVSAVELGALGGPSGSDRGRRDAVRVPRKAPVASPATTLAEISVPNLPAVSRGPSVSTVITESATAPAPAPVVEPVAVGIEPGGPYIGNSPEPASGGSSGNGDWGRGRGNGGAGTGVVIRGGHAGDDHCEPRGGRRIPANGMPGMGGILGTLGGGGGDRSGGERIGGRMPFPRY